MMRMMLRMTVGDRYDQDVDSDDDDEPALPSHV